MITRIGIATRRRRTVYFHMVPSPPPSQGRQPGPPDWSRHYVACGHQRRLPRPGTTVHSVDRLLAS